jgi:hypothetical protein
MKFLPHENPARPLWPRSNTGTIAQVHPLNASRFEITAPYESAHNARYGLTAASEMLRHADVAVTAAHDVENKKRSALGFGHLLKSERAIIPIRGEAPRSQAINEQRREFMRRLKLL